MSFNSQLSSPEKVILNGVDAGAALPSGRAIYEQRKQYGKASANMGEISQYNVEHLISFAVERKDGLLTVDDSIRKLKLLNARGKIWAQEALMQVDEKAVKIFDQTSQDELEHFPLVAIQHLQTVTDADSFCIVAIVIKDTDQKTPDIHLYHCPHVPADVISADIESALADCKDKKGRMTRPETLRRARERVEATVIPPPPLNPPPAPPMKDDSVRKRVEAWGMIGHQTGGNTSPRDMDSESPEVLLLKLNRDVQILNHTLDDIEDFVSKLHKSAEALKELSSRKRKKSKAKKKMAGDGMLTLRAKLPPQERFIECFRKFKLAFNLLAKLKTHIQKPNAVEIVHFLFSPLEMCLRACGGYDIPRAVESPLLTKDAIDMLENCTTTYEAELWGNLGDFWTKSRIEFPKEHYFPPYIPQFRSGWEPPPILRSNSDSSDHTAELAATIAEQANRVNAAEEARRASDFNDSASMAFKQHVERHVERNQTANGKILQSPPGSAITKVCRSMYDFAGRNKNELDVVRDELLEVLEDDKAWWKVRNKRGDVGFVPGTHMLLMSSAHKSPASSNSDGASTVNGPVQIPLPPPPIPPLSPVNTNNANLYTRPAKSRVGQPVPPPPPLPSAPAQRDVKKSLNMNGNNNQVSTNQIHIKKPANNPPAVAPDQLQQELRQRVNTQQAQKRNFNIPKKTATSSSFKLSDDSTPEEVRRWLQSRAFSQLTVESLGVLNGAQLFTLTKNELKTVCDDEGARVYSQLLVQKSMTINAKGDDELARIMKKRQQMADEG